MTIFCSDNDRGIDHALTAELCTVNVVATWPLHTVSNRCLFLYQKRIEILIYRELSYNWVYEKKSDLKSSSYIAINSFMTKCTHYLLCS
jgi:hypothetical protein